MTEETENLVLEMLRRVRASQERMELDIADLKRRASATEQVQGQILALLGGLGQRMDRFEERLSRIERRLDLVDAS
jgi:hypothetical protein